MNITSSTAPLATNSKKYLNRELSLVAFNERVLALCELNSIPILERLKYLTIVSSNLDELFEIRVSGLKAQIVSENLIQPYPDGLSPNNTFEKLHKRIRSLVNHQYTLFNKKLLPNLKDKGIYLHSNTSISEKIGVWAQRFFLKEIYPILTPIGLDPAHPFPRVLNKSLNFIIKISGNDSFGREGRIAIIQAPRSLPRIIRVPKELTKLNHEYVLLSSFVELFAETLFPAMNVYGVYQFRVTRNSDLFVDEEEVTDLRKTLQGELSQRNYGDAVRLEVSKNISIDCLNLLLKEFSLGKEDCYETDGPVNLIRLNSLIETTEEPSLKFPTLQPKKNYFKKIDNDLFKSIKDKDILLHHPYQSFDTVVEFINSAANDPNVVAISQTIYRTGSTSELMQSLINAAKKGKEVTAIVELMARFDEETNISWASRLEEIGAHVVFGVVGNKTHAKMCLIVRKEAGLLKRYVHLGTGNYHPRTAKLYTDFGLITANKKICNEVHQIFLQLTGLGKPKPLNFLWLSPFKLHSNVLRAINREIKNVKNGKQGKIIARMNSLIETKTIDALYKASKNGVKIDLIVRGICALRPSVIGLSENIRVFSTVGRFLEHSRIFYFRNAGADDVYLSSADWMDRNFFRRVELAFPILDETLKKRVIDEGLKVHLKDNFLTWKMKEDGAYRINRKIGENKFSSQDYLLEFFQEKN